MSPTARILLALAVVSAAGCAGGSTGAPTATGSGDDAPTVATSTIVLDEQDDGDADLAEESDASVTTGPPPTDAPTTTLPPWTPPEHRVIVDGGRFVERTTGEPFVPRGVNIVDLVDGVDRTLAAEVFDRDRMAVDFARLADAGYNTVRFFLDNCSDRPGCLTQIGRPGIGDEALDVLVEVLDLADEYGLVLLLTSNDLPDGGGYRDRVAAGDVEGVFPGYRNSDFLTAEGHAAMAAYWDDLLTGLVERRANLAPVLGWSILNEQWLFELQPPLTLESGEATTASGTYDLAEPGGRRTMVAESLRALIATVAEVIRHHDPHGLVTMGFFSPDEPNETEIGGDWYVDTAPLVEDSDLDFFDFHLYAGDDITPAQAAENFGIDERKPVVMGEVGAFVSRTGSAFEAALGIQRTIAASCDAGWDGWLVWAHRPIQAPDRTWSFVEDDGLLLEALSPVAQPDPCVVTLRDPDLAGSATVRVSQFLPGEEPELAVDASLASQWGSGDDPPQWIEFVLDEPSAIGSIVLTAAQFPDGDTIHEVIVDDAVGTGRTVHEFVGFTSAGDELVVEFDPPLEAVTRVRVLTRAGPSWVSWSDVELLAAG